LGGLLPEISPQIELVIELASPYYTGPIIPIGQLLYCCIAIAGPILGIGSQLKARLILQLPPAPFARAAAGGMYRTQLFETKRKSEKVSLFFLSFSVWEEMWVEIEISDIT
jgi:hypothetical protein